MEELTVDDFWPTLLGLKPNFNQTTASTTMTRPLLHSTLCALPMLTGPCNEVGHLLDGAVSS